MIIVAVINYRKINDDKIKQTHEMKPIQVKINKLIVVILVQIIKLLLY